MSPWEKVPDEVNYLDVPDVENAADIFTSYEMNACQIEKCNEMKEKFSMSPISGDTRAILRFLRARNFDVEKASKMCQAHLEWRESFFPIKRNEVIEDLKADRQFSLGLNPNGNLVIYWQLVKFSEDTFEVDSVVKAYVYMLELAYRALPAGSKEKACIFLNCEGMQGPPAISFLQELNTVFEANYPERAEKVVLYPIPWLVQKVVNGMLWFVDATTRSKFVVCNNEKEVEEGLGISMTEITKRIADRCKATSSVDETIFAPPCTVQGSSSKK